MLGQNTDRTGRTMSILCVLTWAVALINAAPFRIADEPACPWTGFVMLLGARLTGAENTQYFGIIGVAVVLAAVLLGLLARAPKVTAGAVRD